MKVLALVFAVAVVALLVGAFSPVTAPGGSCEGCGDCVDCVKDNGPFSTYGECCNVCPGCEDPPCVPGNILCEKVDACDGEI